MADTTQLQQNDDLDILVSEPSGAPAQVKKVELDLDDAPFLQTEEKTPPSLAAEGNLDIVTPQDDGEQARRKKKKLIIIGAICALALAGGIAAWWFFLREPPVPPAPPLEPEVIVVPSPPAAEQKQDIVREFAPFVVPIKDARGQTSFLICKFAALTQNPALGSEIDSHLVQLRDAIYYYLRGKDSAFLVDAHNGNQIKTDLLSIFNDYLTQGKLEDILFESYIHK